MRYGEIKKRELIRFLFGGGSAVAVDFLVYHGLMAVGLAMGVAKAVSFICGSIVGFIINKFWTFESKRFSKGEILRYAVLYSCTAGINTLVNTLALKVVPVSIVGFLCATGVSTVLNFLGQKFFVFKK